MVNIDEYEKFILSISLQLVKQFARLGSIQCGRGGESFDKSAGIWDTLKDKSRAAAENGPWSPERIGVMTWMY